MGVSQVDSCKFCGGGRYNWWCQSSMAGSATNFTNVNNNGNPNNNSSSNTWVGAPL